MGGEDPVALLEEGNEPGDAVSQSEATSLTAAPRSAESSSFGAAISMVGGDVVIDWPAQPGAIDYTVWHSYQAYSEPGDPGSFILTAGTMTSASHAVVGDGQAHYYRVVAHTAGGDELSNAVGKHAHHLYPGYNKLPQALDTGITDAQTLASKHPGYAYSIHRFDAWISNFLSWWNGYGGAPFTYGLGDVPIVNAGGIWDHLYEEVGRVPGLNEIQTPVANGLNLVTVPLSMGDTSASAVLASMDETWRVGYWDPIAQTRVWHDGTNADFLIKAGEDIYLDTWAEALFPPELIVPELEGNPNNPVPDMGPAVAVVTGMELTEGATWLAGENALLFTNIPTDRVYRADLATGEVTIERDQVGAFTNGMTRDQSGNRIECQHATQQVVRVEANGSETVLASEWNGTTLNSPNDVVTGPDGSLYFSDATIGAYPHLGNVQNMPLGFQGVYRIDPTGTVHLVDDIFADPTGVGISPDGTTLYVSDWTTGMLHRYPILPDGSTGAGTMLTDTVPNADGMCLDVEGNIYLTTSQGLWVLDDEGNPLGLLPLLEESFNCTFGGAGMQTLFITSLTSVYAVDVPIPGSLGFGG